MIFLLRIFFFLLPFQFALAPGAGVDLAVARIAAAFIFLVWIVGALFRRSIWIPRTWTSALLASFLFLAAFSLTGAWNIPWGLRKLAFLVNFIPLYFVLSDTFHRNNGSVPVILRSVVSGGIVAALIALLQFTSQFALGVPSVVEFWRSTILPIFLGPSFGDAAAEYSSLLVNVRGMTLLRATAFFPDPHVAAYYFGLCAAFAAGFAWHSGQRKWSVAADILILADVLTFSRGGYLGLAAGSVVFGLAIAGQSLRPGQRRRYFAIATGALAIGILAILFTPFGDRFRSSFSVTEGSNEGRLAMWTAGAQAITTHPLSGVGLGNFPLFVKPSADYREPIYAHDLFLDIAAETGILNGIIFIFLIFWTFLALWRHGRSDRILFGAAAGMALFLIHSLVETPVFSVHILPLFLLLLALGTMEPSPRTR